MFILFFDDQKKTVSKWCLKKGRAETAFTTCPWSLLRPVSTNTRFMERFKIDFNEGGAEERFEIVFRQWEKRAVAHTLEFWDEDNSQIPRVTHQIESAGNVAIRMPAVPNDVGFTYHCYEQRDFTMVHGDQTFDIQSKNLVDNNSVVIHRPGSQIYDRSRLDFLLCAIPKEDVPMSDRIHPWAFGAVRCASFKDPEMKLGPTNLYFSSFKNYRDFPLTKKGMKECLEYMKERKAYFASRVGELVYDEDIETTEEVEDKDEIGSEVVIGAGDESVEHAVSADGEDELLTVGVENNSVVGEKRKSRCTK